MEIHKFDIIQDTDEHYGVIFLGSNVNPENYEDQSPGLKYGVPRDHIAGMWLRPVTAKTADGETINATALAGITIEGYHFAFDIQPVQSFAPVVLN